MRFHIHAERLSCREVPACETPPRFLSESPHIARWVWAQQHAREASRLTASDPRALRLSRCVQTAWEAKTSLQMRAPQLQNQNTQRHILWICSSKVNTYVGSFPGKACCKCSSNPSLLSRDLHLKMTVPMKLTLWKDTAPEKTEDGRKGQTASKLPTSAKVHPHTFPAVSIRRPSVIRSWLSP